MNIMQSAGSRIKQLDQRGIIGWTAVALSTAVICFWAFWGIIENFHEGWYFQSWLSNLGLMVAQYLSPLLLSMGVTLIAIFWPRLGAGLHVILALFAAWFFNVLANPALLLLIAPLAGLGALYWIGRPQPRAWAAVLCIALPLLTLFAAGIGPIIRVSQRFDDGERQAREVQGNGVTLIWAPDGPGWPSSGANWFEARQACQFLSEDGLATTPVAQDLWRLPTVDEAVRSMARHGRNSGGVWNNETAQAVYVTKPDKESPLWNPHSQVIYWWTATEIDEEYARIIVYDGRVWPRAKQLRQGYLGFRCVKNP